MPSLIPRLPNEITLEILSQITDRATLAALALQSHALNRQITPLLYHTVEYRRPWPKNDPASPSAGEVDPRPSLTFALIQRTLVDNPSIAAQVKRLEIGPWELSED